MKNLPKNAIIMRLMKVLHMLVLTAMLVACVRIWYVPMLGLERAWAYSCAAAIVYFMLAANLGRIYGIYRFGVSRIRHLVYAQGLTIFLSAAVGYAAASVIKLRFINPLPLLGTLGVQLVWCIAWTLVANRVYFRVNRPKNTVVLYKEADQLQMLEEIPHLGGKFQISSRVLAEGSLEQLQQALEGAEAAILLGLNWEARNSLIKHCITQGIHCYFPPRVGDVLVSGGEHMEAFSVPLMRVRQAIPPVEYVVIKRCFDVVASALAIIVASPFMLATAIAIKAQDKGPVLYKQVRLTKGGKAFKVLKFRSMRVDAEKDGVARLATENDDRITPVGKFIRKIRFDELPQLFNILKGDMSIVGPRPERPEIARQYEEEIPSFGLRLQVKAGLTGYAQVYGRYNTTPYDKLKMDLMYINRMSVFEDLRIMLATVKVLFMKESTEGIQEGQTTASHKEEQKDLQNV